MEVFQDPVAEPVPTCPIAPCFVFPHGGTRALMNGLVRLGDMDPGDYSFLSQSSTGSRADFQTFATKLADISAGRSSRLP